MITAIQKIGYLLKHFVLTLLKCFSFVKRQSTCEPSTGMILKAKRHKIHLCPICLFLFVCFSPFQHFAAEHWDLLSAGCPPPISREIFLSKMCFFSSLPCVLCYRRC